MSKIDKEYKRIYPSNAKAIENGEEVTITYQDYDEERKTTRF